MPRHVPSALQSSGSISAAVAASRVLGLVRMSLQSRLIGAGALADTFSVAFRIPNLLRDLLAEGALSSAFVPTFTSYLVQEDRERAYQLANLALAGILLVTGTLTLLGVVFAEPLVVAITSGWSAEKIAETAALTRVMMPILALVSVGAVWGGVLNAQRHFLPFALAPALFNLVSITAGAGMWLAGLGGRAAVLAWSVGTLLASVTQAAVLLPYLRRLGYRARPQLRGLLAHPGIRRIVALMLPAIVGVAAVQLNVFVNTRFAASLGDGAVAQVEYAFRIFFLPIGVFGVALATVTTTQVSEEAARGDRSRLIARTGEGLSAAWLLTSASTVGLVLLAHPIVSLIYEGGRFSAAESAAVALILQAYAIGLAPYSMVKIVAPAFYSIDRPRVPLIASLASVAANIGFNAFTYERLGPAGLALGTSIGALVNLTLLRAFYRREIGGLARPGRWRELGVLAAANAALGAVVWAAWAGVSSVLADSLAALPRLLRGLLGAGTLALVIALGFVVFAAIVRAGRYPGGAQLWGLPGGILRRLRRRRAKPA
nr:murein biosynthesis integral membrane protein MurJ [Nannocystis pusilla]